MADADTSTTEPNIITPHYASLFTFCSTSLSEWEGAINRPYTSHVYETLAERRNRVQMIETYKVPDQSQRNPARKFHQEE